MELTELVGTTTAEVVGTMTAEEVVGTTTTAEVVGTTMELVVGMTAVDEDEGTAGPGLEIPN